MNWQTILIYISTILHGIILGVSLMFSPAIVRMIFRFLESHNLLWQWHYNISNGQLYFGLCIVIFIAIVHALGLLMIHLADSAGIYKLVNRKKLTNAWRISWFIGYLLGILLISLQVDQKLFG